MQQSLYNDCITGLIDKNITDIDKHTVELFQNVTQCIAEKKTEREKYDYKMEMTMNIGRLVGISYIVIVIVTVIFG